MTSIDKQLLQQAEDEALVQALQSNLNQQAGAIDAATLSKLRQARERALEHARQRPSFWVRLNGAIPLAAAASVLVAVLVLYPAIKGVDSVSTSVAVNGEVVAEEAFDLMASGDSMELYSDLEFYQWLAVQEHAG